jgi:formylglycine-generating enzyme required for sulfatase activity
MLHDIRRAFLTILAAIAIAAPARAQSCAGDIARDGRTDGGDLGVLLANWGPVTATELSRACDIDSNGQVDGADLGVLLSNWGPCPATVSGIAPTEGCFVGGTQLTIRGTYLGTTTEVTVGGVPATNLVASVSSVIVTVPAGSLGPATVRVTTAAGTIISPQTFTYMPASVSSIAPNAGTTAGGSQITITGAYLALTTGVTIGGASCTDVTVVNPTTVTAVTPAGALGSADVVLWGGKGTTTVPGGFTYQSIVVPSWATLIEAQPDPAVVTDPALRAAITATGLAWRVRDTLTQVELLLVPPGTFLMGCSMGSNQWPCYTDALPVHPVTLTGAYYLGRYELTQSQWQSRMGDNPSQFQGLSDSPSRPVERVSWDAIQGYLSSTGFRLPTEAEWEYACRAGTLTPFHSGPGFPNGTTDDSLLPEIAWIDCAGGCQTKPIGQKAANGYGFHDMLGNVWEWVNDGLATYESGAQVNPTGPANPNNRVYRGGAYYQVSVGATRSDRRAFDPPNYKGSDIGFRVARNP